MSDLFNLVTRELRTPAKVMRIIDARPSFHGQPTKAVVFDNDWVLMLDPGDPEPDGVPVCRPCAIALGGG